MLHRPTRRLGIRSRSQRLLFCFALFLVLANCTITIVSGPSTVTVGEIVTYELEVGTNFIGTNDVTLYVIADVPTGWLLQSSTYEGTANGAPVSGDGTVVTSTLCDPLTGDVMPGYQRLHIAAGPFGSTSSSDSGTLSLDFDVESQPNGEFKIFFRFASDEESSDCSSPAVRTINSDGNDLLRFVEALFNGDGDITGLNSPISLTASADGRHVLATAELSIAVFSRDAASGELDFVEAIFDDASGLSGVNGIANSPDGLHVYAVAASDNALTVFSRNTETGELTVVETLFHGEGGINGLEGVRDVTVSPDGNHVYTTSFFNALSTFERDHISGELTFIGALFEGVGGVDGLAGLDQVAVSQDGSHVYTISGFSDNALALFSRDQLTGELSFVEALFDGVDGVEGLEGGNSLAITADGRHLYASASETRGTVAVFSRDTETGTLTFLEVHEQNMGGVIGLERPQEVGLGANDRHVFATGRNSIVVFARDPSTGLLTFVEAQFQGDPPNQGLGSTRTLIVSPDGNHLYSVGADENSLATFQASVIFADGFESGDTSRW